MGGMGDAFAARLAKQRAKADNPDAVPDLTPPPRQPPPQALPGMAGGGGGGGAGPFGGGDAFAARLAKQRAKAENPEGVPTDLTPTKPAFAQAKEPSSGDLARDAFQARLAKQRAKADNPDMVPKRPSLTEKTDKKPAGSTMPPMDAKLAARLARQREKEVAKKGSTRKISLWAMRTRIFGGHWHLVLPVSNQLLLRQDPRPPTFPTRTSKATI